MKLETVGILIDIKPLSERDSLARIFTRDYGVMIGVMRGAVIAKKNRPLIGQAGAVSWNARLDSQLGVFHWEASRNMAALIMADFSRLAMMNAAFALIGALLPERERYDTLYNQTVEFINILSGCRDVVGEYLGWEINFLREIGYALDLSACAGCGKHDSLNYLSPRTCRAVCDACAAPYIERLYRLPMTLDVAVRLIERVCAAQGADMPVARRILCHK